MTRTVYFSRPDDDIMTPMTPTNLVTFSDSQFERLLNALAPKPLPEPSKTTTTVQSSPHLHNVFNFASQLNDDVDPKRVHECLQHEAKFWYKSLGEVFKAGFATRISNWITELKKRFSWTAGKASVSLLPRRARAAAARAQRQA